MLIKNLEAMPKEAEPQRLNLLALIPRLLLLLLSLLVVPFGRLLIPYTRDLVSNFLN